MPCAPPAFPATAASVPKFTGNRHTGTSQAGPGTPLPNARELGETSIAFPVHPGIGAERMDVLADTAHAVLTQAARS